MRENLGALRKPIASTRHTVWSALCATAVALVGACGDTAPKAEAVLDLPAASDGRTVAQLGFDSGALGPAGTPIYLRAGEGALAPDLQVRDGDDAAQLLRSLAAAYHLAPQTGFQVVSDITDDTFARRLKLQQLHDGVPVTGAQVVVELTGDRVTALLGELAGDLRPTATPAMDGDAAMGKALADLGALGRGRAPVIHEAPTLRVFRPAGQGAVLAWRALVEYTGAEGHELAEVFAAADTGKLLARHSHVYRALDRKIYDLAKVCLKDGSELPGALKLSEGGAASTDKSVNNAYKNTGQTYYFYKFFHNRDSYDNAGASLVSSVHGTFDTGSGGCSADNAAWIGDVFNQMVYGDGSGLVLTDTTAGMDVTAHELTHAVTDKTSHLTYENESGALNEAMSDIQGCGAEAWTDSGGGATGGPATITASANTWKIGEKVVGILLWSLGALRLMDNPTKDGSSKDYYPERFTGADDNGGVHLNSGIANLAFYLLSQGGAHPRSKTPGVTVPAIGISKGLKIFHLANTSYFTETTDFQAARYATAHAAQTLYGRCSAEWAAVHKAWDAVGVLGGWTPCRRPPSKF